MEETGNHQWGVQSVFELLPVLHLLKIRELISGPLSHPTFVCFSAPTGGRSAWFWEYLLPRQVSSI